MSRSRQWLGCESLHKECGERGVECGSTKQTHKEREGDLQCVNESWCQAASRGYERSMSSHVGGYDRFRASALGDFWNYRLFIYFCGTVYNRVNWKSFAIPMQSSLIHEEIGWSGYLYLSKCLLMWQIERQRGEGKGQMEEVREKRR